MRRVFVVAVCLVHILDGEADFVAAIFDLGIRVKGPLSFGLFAGMALESPSWITYASADDFDKDWIADRKHLAHVFNLVRGHLRAMQKTCGESTESRIDADHGQADMRQRFRRWHAPCLSKPSISTKAP